MRLLTASLFVILVGVAIGVLLQPSPTVQANPIHGVPDRIISHRADRMARVPPRYDYEGEKHAIRHVTQIKEAERERLEARAAAQAQAQEAARLAPPITRPSRPPKPAASTTASLGASWERIAACIRNIESGGNYRAVNPSGKYRGAYQFGQRTWNGVAARHAPHLVGVRPDAAAPAEQDLMAYHLWRERGLQPWPTPRRRCA